MPLQPLLDDAGIEEIWINEPGRVFVARRGRSELTNLILTAAQVAELVERMLRPTGRRIDLSTPFVDAMLPDGSRLHVVIPNITRRHMAVNIRKFAVGLRTLDELVGTGSLTEQAARFLDASVAAGLNVLVAGGTQAGKTTLLNALCGAIPARERVVSVEEVFELSLRLPDVVAMQTRQANLEGTGEIPLRRLVKEALRMRPSRLIVGEVRQEECLDLLIALNSGLPGMCTLHANSAREALVKMCTLPLLAGENVSAAFVVPTVATSVDLVVHLSMDPSGARRVREIRRRHRPRRGRRHRDDGDLRLPSRASRAGRRLPAAPGALRVGRHRSGRRARATARRGPCPSGSVDVGALVGLIGGIGLLLIWRSGPRAPVQSGTSAAGWTTRRREMLRQAGIDGVGPGQLAGAQVLAALIAFVLVVALTKTIAVAVCFGVFGFFLPALIVRRLRKRRQGVLRELWPEAIDNLASAVRAGMSLPEGLAALAVRGPTELRAPFAGFAASYRATGRFGDCLDALKDDLSDPVGDRVCETMRVAREVGGSDLGTVLRTLSELLRADARTRSELETRQGWVINAARLAVAAPWVVLLLLGTQSETLRAYDTPGGTLLLAIGAGVCVVAYRVMQHIGKLPEEQRVLR